MSDTPLIHPTAIIPPEARLGVGVRVGAYAVVEGPAEVGAGSVLEAHSILTGRVRLGEGVRVGHGAVIGGAPQDFAFDPATESSVEVGDRTQIREHCTIHRGTTPGSVTRVGSDCLLMATVHIGHNSQLGDHVVIANGSMLGGYVEVGDRVFIGGDSVFHQHVRIGRGVMTQGMSGVGKDIPPFTMAAEINQVWGLNVVGLRRAGIGPAERAEIKEAFKLLYASGLNVSQAVTAARERAWGASAAEFWAFVKGAKKRGICALGKSARAED